MAQFHPDQASYLRGKRYNGEKQSVPNASGKNQHSEVGDQNDTQAKTADRLATEYRVSAPTIKRETAFNLWLACHTQEQTAKAMGGWSREAVKDYKALKKISEEAWKLIGATFNDLAPDEESDEAPANGATAPKTKFSERLLRNILDLEPGQQVELCGYLAKGKDVA